jgi:hypothetical protein
MVQRHARRADAPAAAGPLERDRFSLNRLNGAITLWLFVQTRDSRFGVTPFEAITLWLFVQTRDSRFGVTPFEAITL